MLAISCTSNVQILNPVLLDLPEMLLSVLSNLAFSLVSRSGNIFKLKQNRLYSYRVFCPRESLLETSARVIDIR